VAEADSLIGALETYLASAGESLDPRVKAAAELRVRRIRDEIGQIEAGR
jgi:hypothetical protein